VYYYGGREMGRIPGLDHKTHSYGYKKYMNTLKNGKYKNMKGIRVITIEDFPRRNKGKKSRNLRYIKYYVIVDVEDRVEVSSERFNGITHTNINLTAFREVMLKED
jgi:hypothetical protein